jgi:long-chain acyl-CoA synthetase
LSPAQSGEAQARLGIYGINRSEWTKLLMAAFSQRICVAPLYDTLGANACTFIIGHAELTTVACERSKLDNMLKSKASLPKFVNVVLFEDPTPEEIGKAKAAGLSLRGVSDLAKAGKSAAKAESPDSVPTGFPKPEDWGYIMYTSGTTGDPKGVLLSHQNIISSSGGLLRQNPHLDLLRPDDVYLSFLPLAHSFETCMQVCCILVGCGVGFYQGDARKLVSEDMPDLRPTIMAAVPRIYARIYDKVMAGSPRRSSVGACQRAVRAGSTRRCSSRNSGAWWAGASASWLQARRRCLKISTGSSPRCLDALSCKGTG